MNRIITRGLGPSHKLVTRGYGGFYIAPSRGAKGKAFAETYIGLTSASFSFGNVSSSDIAGEVLADGAIGSIDTSTVSGEILAATVAGAVSTAGAKGSVMTIADISGKAIGLALPTGEAVILEGSTGKAEGEDE